MKASLKKSATKKTEREPGELAQLALRSLNRHIADEAVEERPAGEAAAREVEAFREAVATKLVVFRTAEGEVANPLVEASPRRNHFIGYDLVFGYEESGVLRPASEAIERRAEADLARLRRVGEKKPQPDVRHPLTPWGKPARGYKSRNKKSAKGTARRQVKAK
jgi:hypothetical protein